VVDPAIAPYIRLYWARLKIVFLPGRRCTTSPSSELAAPTITAGAPPHCASTAITNGVEVLLLWT